MNALRAVALLLACWGCGAAGPTLPGVGPQDGRVPVDPAQPPWRAIGRVQTELGGRCTGFLIAPRVALTAAHCLYRRAPGAFVQPGSVHFLLGYDRGAYAGHARVVAFRIGPGYEPERGPASAGADWAALVLDAPLGTADRVLKLATTLPAPGATLLLGGYGQDRAERIDADLHCALAGLGRDGAGRTVFLHNCSGTRGTSGAPVIVRDGDGWAAIGVQVAAVAGESRGIAVPVAAITVEN